MSIVGPTMACQKSWSQKSSCWPDGRLISLGSQHLFLSLCSFFVLVCYFFSSLFAEVISIFVLCVDICCLIQGGTPLTTHSCQYSNFTILHSQLPICFDLFLQNFGLCPIRLIHPLLPLYPHQLLNNQYGHSLIPSFLSCSQDVKILLLAMLIT